MTLPIKIQDETFILHPTGSVFWESRKMLLLSDVHLGKIAHFRKHGIALPEQSAQGNYGKLDTILEFFQPETILFLGDLFHSSKNTEWSLFETWIKKTTARIVLVAGNHDIIDIRHYENLHVTVVPEIAIGSFLLTHHPVERQGFFNFSGHLHPAVRLRGSGRQWLQLPCFFRKPDQLIFPAFGEFTGNSIVTPTTQDCIYAIAGDEVIAV